MRSLSGSNELYVILVLVVVTIQLLCNPTPFFQDSAEKRHRPPRVGCFFMAGKSDFELALSVRYAWGRKCTKFVIVTNGVASHRLDFEDRTTILDISSVIRAQLRQRGYHSEGKNENKNSSLPYTSFPSSLEETKSSLSLKSFYSWLAMADLFANGNDAADDMDFVMKADPDTYMLMDNYLSYLRRGFCSREHAHIGRVFRADGDFRRPYVSGLSVTLSRSTLLLFADSASIDGDERSKCAAEDFVGQHEAEDYALSECLQSLGVYPAWTRDSEGRERFMHFSPSFHEISGGKRDSPSWYRRFSFGKALPPSPEACAFHYVAQERQNDTLVYEPGGSWYWAQK